MTRRAPIRSWPEFAADAVAITGVDRSRVDSGALARLPLAVAVPEVLIGAGALAPDYPPAAVFLDRTGPAFALAPPGRVGEGLRVAPLVVSFSPFLDASTALADYVLPDHAPLERWEDAETAPASGFPVFRVRQPAIVPVHETRQTETWCWRSQGRSADGDNRPLGLRTAAHRAAGIRGGPG